jgi:hypothetical protein
MKEMKLLKAVTTVCGLALFGALAPAIKADEWNQKTVVTFSGPVEIPGVHLTGWSVLPAGTYVFKLLDSQSDRHIVQIFNQEESKIYATILAIPNYRMKPTDQTVITFRERPAGEPEALRAWFYPGENFGHEFVYPKEKAMQLAKETKTPVLAADIPAESAEPIKTADEPAAVAMKQAPVNAVSGQEVTVAEVVTPVAETPAAELPATASPVPMFALFGVLALCGGLALRVFEKHAS